MWKIGYLFSVLLSRSSQHSTVQLTWFAHKSYTLLALHALHSPKCSSQHASTTPGPLLPSHCINQCLPNFPDQADARPDAKLQTSTHKTASASAPHPKHIDLVGDLGGASSGATAAAAVPPPGSALRRKPSDGMSTLSSLMKDMPPDQLQQVLQGLLQSGTSAVPLEVSFVPVAAQHGCCHCLRPTAQCCAHSNTKCGCALGPDGLKWQLMP